MEDICNTSLSQLLDQDLNDFDRRLKGNRNLEDQHDSSSEDDAQQPKKFSTEADVLKEKNRILMEKLFKSEKQVNEYKEMVEAISSGGKTDNKDKKIIELAKKNRSLQLQVESLKTKAAKAAEFALKLKSERDTEEATMSPKKTMEGSMMTTVADDKRVKEAEKKVTKLRNENQALKSELDKAVKVLEREIGEVVNLDDMLREDTAWKGRAQKIEVLKAQVKRLKQEASMGGDGMSVISETPSVFTGKITHAERNLSKLDQNKAKELEKLQREVDEQKEELKEVKTKYKAAVARRDTLENQLKEIKGEFTGKMKILIEKTENDDKLIHMLKGEVKRLETTKGVKSQLSGGPTLSGGGASSAMDVSEIQKLRAENGRLKNQIKCLEIELEQKNDKVKTLMTSCVGAPDERLEEKELRIADLEDKVEAMEKENFRIRQDMGKGFGKTAGEFGRTKDETEKIIKDLSKQNAVLRRKLDDALEKLAKYESGKH